MDASFIEWVTEIQPCFMNIYFDDLKQRNANEIMTFSYMTIVYMLINIKTCPSNVNAPSVVAILGKNLVSLQLQG